MHFYLMAIIAKIEVWIGTTCDVISKPDGMFKMLPSLSHLFAWRGFLVLYVSLFLREWCSLSDSFTVKLEITSTWRRGGENVVTMWVVYVTCKLKGEVFDLGARSFTLFQFSTPFHQHRISYLQPIKHLDENLVFLYLLNMYIGPFDK